MYMFNRFISALYFNIRSLGPHHVRRLLLGTRESQSACDDELKHKHECNVTGRRELTEQRNTKHENRTKMDELKEQKSLRNVR